MSPPAASQPGRRGRRWLKPPEDPAPSRARAAAQRRALARLAREHAARYAELYAEERRVAS